MTIPPISQLITTAYQPTAPGASAQTRRDASTPFAASLRHAESVGAVTVGTMPSGPPPEVLAAIATAAEAWDGLTASGRSVSFDLDSGSGRVSATLTDASGNPLRSLSGSETLAIAAGESVR